MSAATITRQVEGIEALAPWVRDLMSEVQGLRDQAKALEAQAKALEAELVEAANASPMGECPDWCETQGKRDHAWEPCLATDRPAGFLRHHYGRKGDWYVGSFEVVRVDGSRFVPRLTRSKTPRF